jgi:hypothetical protein
MRRHAIKPRRVRIRDIDGSPANLIIERTESTHYLTIREAGGPPLFAVFIEPADRSVLTVALVHDARSWDISSVRLGAKRPRKAKP